MNPKEKAKELVDMYKKLPVNYYDAYMLKIAKQCALIAVQFAKENPLNTDGYNKYLDEVKAEIEKL